MDTIDVSNLNRQFLFHKEHVGKSKSEVAKESALSFNPNVNIKAFQDNIMTSKYGVSFFKKFTIVLNALDNRQARNHVNRMCLTANVPLIESGTAGYNGQVELIKKGVTQCYECQPKAAQKTYPGCTIRNTPSEPIHCIVWAKHLFNQLFGEYNADEDVSPDTADPEAAANAGNEALGTESNEKGNVERVSTRQWADNCKYNPEKLFNKLFHDDIKYLLSMANLWKNRVSPQPIKYGEYEEAGTSVIQPVSNLRDQNIWSLLECAKVFEQSTNSISKEFYKLKTGEYLIWDKDDKAAMDFVASCANIRAHIYHISQKSKFEIKSMAGNIIPAIATTNAITAGFVVMHTFNILMDQIEKCQSVYMRLRPNGRNQLFVPDRVLNAPNPKCYVCSPKPEVVLKIDTNKVTVKELRDDVLKKALNMIDPDVMLDGKGIIVISSEEGETDCNNDKLLSTLSIVDGAILKVDDFLQEYELTITIIQKDAERDEPLFEVIADPDTVKPESMETDEKKSPVKEIVDESAGASTSSSNGNKVAVDDEDDDDLCIIDDDEEVAVVEPSPKKRKIVEEEDGPSTKRAKVQDNLDASLIVLDDD